MYSETVLALASAPRHERLLASYSASGLVGIPGEGAYVQIWIQVEDDRISSATFRTYSCPAAKACSEMTCRVAESAPLENLSSLAGKDVIVLLRGLPDGKSHLADMAVQALHTALANLNDAGNDGS